MDDRRLGCGCTRHLPGRDRRPGGVLHHRRRSRAGPGGDRLPPRVAHPGHALPVAQLRASEPRLLPGDPRPGRVGAGQHRDPSRSSPVGHRRPAVGDLWPARRVRRGVRCAPVALPTTVRRAHRGGPDDRARVRDPRGRDLASDDERRGAAYPGRPPAGGRHHPHALPLRPAHFVVRCEEPRMRTCRSAGRRRGNSESGRREGPGVARR